MVGATLRDGVRLLGRREHGPAIQTIDGDHPRTAGKPAKVALGACMRKLLAILGATTKIGRPIP